ncbi:MAG: DNA polymerase III subunit gamma/tau [Bacteroidales bacterium]|nr:DNA polymerase III subunit gamma/tau [Bacteroidales bacterium]
MEEFIVSARKYRPATFETVVGQLSITTTLKNSIKNNHLGQAYLFCGPRGVGKTTCARIFAKTINCMNLSSDIEACDVCESCRAFNENASYNIHELDAASNNSVEDIRSLIEQVRIPPQIGKYSIYIIDEVHMLSTSAFNAFLKTLEEPPKHAIYILATTEKHKILPTILSRCQIFDFNRIKVSDTVEHLKSVAIKENIDAEEAALNVIARKADGGMRDALSIFDQVVSFSGKKVTYQSTIDNLNVLDYDYYFMLTDAFLEENFVQSLVIFDKILQQGFDGHNFLIGLCSHFRDLLVSKNIETLRLLEVGAEIVEKYKQQATNASVEFLYAALDIGNKFDINYKASKNQRLHTELMLLQMCNIVKKKTSLEASSDTQTSGSVVVNASEKTSSVVKDVTNVAKSYGASGLSLDAISNPQKSVEKKTDDITNEEPIIKKNTESQKSAFTNDDLIIAWQECALDYEVSSPRYYSILTASKPKLSGENSIVFTLFSESQKSVFRQEIYQKILLKLKTKLKNDFISIEIIEGAHEQMERKPYTSKEKFEYLNAQNPLLARLKDEFDLGIE